jgi:hypothetical protein
MTSGVRHRAAGRKEFDQINIDFFLLPDACRLSPLVLTYISYFIPLVGFGMLFDCK